MKKIIQLIGGAFVAAILASGKRIEKEEEILPALQWAREQQTPVVLEFMIATEEIVLPMVKSGNPMSEMILK